MGSERVTLATGFETGQIKEIVDDWRDETVEEDNLFGDERWTGYTDFYINTPSTTTALAISGPTISPPTIADGELRESGPKRIRMTGVDDARPPDEEEAAEDANGEREESDAEEDNDHEQRDDKRQVTEVDTDSDQGSPKEDKSGMD